MTELNKLTQQLLAEGFTKENPPSDYVSWDDFGGGWQYHPIQTKEMCLKTPCGLLQKAWFINEMSFGGVNWCLENDNALIYCPYQNKGCTKNNPLIRDLKIGYGFFCEVKITDETYDYEKSAMKVEGRRIQLEEEKIAEFAKTCKNGYCREQVRINHATGELWLDDDPGVCLMHYCTYCTLRKQPVSDKKGNVFYDIKTSKLVKGDGFLPDEMKVSIIKGVRYFEKNRSVTHCEWVAANPQMIQERVEHKYHADLFFSKYHGQHFEVEAMNIRAAVRESRDLDRDLEDIANGFSITHASDLAAAEKERKHNNKVKSQQSKINRIKKRIETSGIENLEKSDAVKIGKWIKAGLITRTEYKSWIKTYEDSKGTGQISFF